MRKIGIIGNGAAGNNVVKVVMMEEDDFTAAAINSTTFDIEELKGLCDDIFIMGGEGCGANRKSSKGLFKKNYTTIINRLKDLLAECDIVIVNAGLGGGTGSGIIAMTAEILRSQLPKSIIIPYGIIPSIKESPRHQSNGLEAMKEMFALDCPYMLVDNDMVNSASPKEIYDKTNKSILTDLKTLRGDYTLYSELGVMDDRDFKTLCKTPGLLTINKISGIKETDLDNMSIDDLIIKSVKESYNVQLEKDKVVGRMGFIISLTHQMLEKLDKSLPKVIAEFGYPIFGDIFMHINEVDTKEETSIITILAGLSEPESRLSEMQEKVNESAKARAAALAKAKTNLIDSNSLLDNDYDDEDGEDKEVNIEDIFGKY